jgi:hypothetical protein
MEVEILPEIPAGARYAAKVTVIDRLVDAASGTYGVRMELRNPRHALPAGIRGRAGFAGVEAAGSRASTARTPVRPPKTPGEAAEDRARDRNRKGL